MTVWAGAENTLAPANRRDSCSLGTSRPRWSASCHSLSPRRGHERRRTHFSRAHSMRNITVTIGAMALLAGCGVSTQQEVQMGQQEAQQVNAQLPMVQDAQ